MAVRRYPGIVENGRVRLEPGVSLEDNTSVIVIAPDGENSPIAERFNLAEMIAQMPTDYQTIEEPCGEPVGKEEW